MKKFKVWWPYQGQDQSDAKTITAFDPEHAASEWARWYDGYSSDYLIVGGVEAELQVQREDETSPRTVTVSGRMERAYTADLEYSPTTTAIQQ